MVLVDGHSGKTAAVDNGNRQSTTAVTTTSQGDATERADSYNINSGDVSVTDASEQGIVYVLNNETRDLHVAAIVCIVGVSAAGTTNKIRIYKNPTAGTLISGATLVDINSNRNFGSNKILSVTAYKGDGSSTVTDGTVHIQSIGGTSNSRIFFGIDEILPTGSAIAVTFEITANAAGVDCEAAVICHLADPKLSTD